MGTIKKKIVDGVVVEVDEQQDPIVKTIENGVVVEKPLSQLKKKEPADLVKAGFAGLSAASKIGGTDGSSKSPIVESEVEPVQATAQDKLKSLGINDVTFEKEEPQVLIEAPKDNFGKPISQPFPNKPTYIDVNNPESLAYLSSKIQQAKKDADPYKYAAGASSEMGLKYNKEFSRKSQEADDLMQEVSSQAATNSFNKILSETHPTKIDRKHLREAGLEFTKQVDPLQYKRIMTIINSGGDLGDELSYNLEKNGGEILQKKLPSVTNDEYALNNLKELNELTDKAHPEIAVAKGFDIIGAYNHQKDNQANGGWLRSRPTVGQVKKWLQEPELISRFTGNEESLRQVQDKVNSIPDEMNGFTMEEVPVGGFMNNFGRAFGSGVESIGNIFRGDVKRQQSNLNPTIGRGTLTGNYRDPGESPALLQRLYTLENKEKDGELSDEEDKELAALRKNTKVRDGWDRFADGTGNLTGQVVVQALGTKGIGLGTKFIPAMAASRNFKTTIDAGIATSLNSFDQTRQQAVYNFPDDKIKQNIYTGTIVLANSVSERIFKDEKVLDAFKRELQGDVINYVKNLSAKNINKAAIKNLVSEKIIKFGGQVTKEANKESFEEGVVQAVDEFAQSTLGAEGYDGDKAIERIGNTYLTTLLYGGVVSSLAARSNMVADKFNRVGIYKMATNPGIFKTEIDRQFDAGEIDTQEKNSKHQLLNTATKLVETLPPKVAVLPTKDRAEYVTQNLNIAINEKLLAETTDPNYQAELKENISESKKRAKEIYDGQADATKKSVLPEEKEINDRWKKNIVAIGERDDITDEEKESLKQVEDERHAIEMSEFALSKKTKTETKPDDAAIIQKAIDENRIRGMDADMARAALAQEGGVDEFLMGVADQALNKVAPDAIGKVDDSQALERAKKTYSPDVVELAINKFPKPANPPIDQVREMADENTPDEISQPIELSTKIPGDEGYVAPEQNQNNEQPVIEEVIEVNEPVTTEKEVIADEGINTESKPAEETETIVEEKAGSGKESSGLPPKEKASVALSGKELADRLRGLKSKSDKLQANIFGIPIAIYDGAIEVIATAIENGAKLAEAISAGIKHIRDNGGRDLQQKEFIKHIEDFASGEKPKIKIQVGEEESESSDQTIDGYEMTTSGEVNKFLSGETLENIFGDKPEGEQQYEVQKLSEMLQDGRNMIDIAAQKWGLDVMDYGKPLFQHIQAMSNDNQLTNKKAVLMATFLGEMKESMVREPDRKGEIQPLYNALEAYYQQYMNVRGKEIVAARLLRLYRDKYIGDIFADRILEQNQVKEKRDIQEAEQNKKVDDEIAESKPRITKKQKDEADNSAKEATGNAKKKRESKKSIKKDDARKMADNKLKDIKDRVGDKKTIIDKINDAIKKLNCK